MSSPNWGCALALVFTALFWAVIVVIALMLGVWLGFVKVTGIG